MFLNYVEINLLFIFIVITHYLLAIEKISLAIENVSLAIDNISFANKLEGFHWQSFFNWQFKIFQ